MLLEGIFLPLTTPFHPDGRLFLHKLASNVEHYSRTQAAGMLVLAQTGEASGLTDIEVHQVMETAIGAAADEKVMIATVGRGSVSATLLLAKAAANLHYDAVAVGGPAFASDASLRREVATYFQTVADQSELPVVLISDRDRPLEVSLIAELAGHANILGVVDDELSISRASALLEATADVSRQVTVTSTFAAATGRMLRQVVPGGVGNFVPAETLIGGVAVVAPPIPAVKTRTKKVGFQILTSATSGMLEAWNAGAAGAIPRLGACAPQACCEVWQAFKDGDPALAAEKQHRILPAAALVEGWPGIAALKYGCDLNAYFGGLPRLPLLPLSAGDRLQVEAALAGLKS